MDGRGPRINEQEVEKDFSEIYESLGFQMDCGKKFMRKYSEKAFYRDEDFRIIEDQIDDISLLGSAIYSKW